MTLSLVFVVTLNCHSLVAAESKSKTTEQSSDNTTQKQSNTKDVVDPTKDRNYPVWKKLAEDGLHDPDNPAIVELQEPGEALVKLPHDFRGIGNQVDWVRALNEGYIDPRSNLYESTELPTWDVDIIMADTAGTALVRFPHKAHTDWLDCSNCHPKPFKAEFNANNITMFSILSGNYCGQCHGAVAFPLTECRRCHSVSRATFTGKPGPQPPPTYVYPPVKEQKAP